MKAFVQMAGSAPGRDGAEGLVKAIQELAEKFIHISSDFYHKKWIELGEKINEIAPFMDNAVSFMTNSGTESVEAAIKLARQSSGATQFIGFLGGFHGRTMGAVTSTASKPVYHRDFYPLMNGVTHVPFPDPYRPILDVKPGEDYGVKVVEYIEEQILNHVATGGCGRNGRVPRLALIERAQQSGDMPAEFKPLVNDAKRQASIQGRDETAMK